MTTGSSTARTERTRLAPSPTGALHPGNARTFLITWALARRRSWRVLLRVEDLDTPRVKPEAVDETISLLQWLGLDWDEGPILQSRQPEPAVEAMRALARAGRVYPCALTRSQIAKAASAPQQGAAPAPFPRALRPPIGPRAFDDPHTNWRFAVDREEVVVEDAFHGQVRVPVAQRLGDAVVWTRRGQPAYQLAVVVDDHRQGVTQVVRGDDLLDSAALQRLLYEALEYAPQPSWTHVPLVVGPDGRRLAKRHGDSRLSRCRALGVPAERVVGWVAWTCGLTAAPAPMDAQEFAQRFDLSLLPRGPVVYGPEDDAWLRERRR